MEMWSIYCLLVAWAVLHKAKAANYEIVGDDEKFFEMCSSAEDLGNFKPLEIFDTSQLFYVYDDDGETVYTNGNLTIKSDIPANAPIQMKLELMQWQRSQWVPTVFSMQRDDFCTSLFDAHELWYSFVMQLPEAQRICPPQKGTIYAMNNVTNRMTINDVHIADLNGKYKAIIHYKVAEYSVCLAIRINIYRM